MKDLLRVLKLLSIGLAVVIGGLYLLMSVHFAGPVKGTVIEEATGKPIEGAIVVVSWSIGETSIFGAINVGQVHVQEVLTDKDGRFSFESWVDYSPWGYGINSSRPQVLAAKPGYFPMWIGPERASRQELGQVIEDKGNEQLQFMMAAPSGGKSADTFGMEVTFLGQRKPSFISSSGVLKQNAPKMKKYLEDYAFTGIKN